MDRIGKLPNSAGVNGGKGYLKGLSAFLCRPGCCFGGCAARLELYSCRIGTFDFVESLAREAVCYIQLLLKGEASLSLLCQIGVKMFALPYQVTTFRHPWPSRVGAFARQSIVQEIQSGPARCFGACLDLIL
jgi:hypothetical protein